MSLVDEHECVFQPCINDAAFIRREKMLAMLEEKSTIPIAKASYYYQSYEARAMEQAGLGSEYITLLAPWREMLKRGFTTFPETPEPTREEAQGWGSHPALDLLSIVAGIHPAGVGFTRVRIEPELGLLTSLDAAMASPSGLISVSYKVSGASLLAHVTLPAKMQGVLVWKNVRQPLRGGEQVFNLSTTSATPKAHESEMKP